MDGKPLVVCCLSGGRADYGLLLSPMRALAADPAFALHVVVTGQHLLDPDIWRMVQAEGFTARAVDMNVSGDDARALTHAVGRCVGGIADVFAQLKPDLLLILGDRYEILGAALAATLAGIPIAHIAGGDVTEGAFDDAFRHAITKLAHLHFVTSDDAARRVRQLGEPANRIFVVGSPGLDLVLTMPPLDDDTFFKEVGLTPRKTNILATYHPVTLARDGLLGLEAMLDVLDARSDTSILITGSNADPQGRAIDARLAQFARLHENVQFVSTLGSQRYFAALRLMDVVIGNSSSGLYEAPSFGISTVNIGDRQKGRLRASSVFDCPPERDAIAKALDAALARGRQATVNPYGDGHASERIVATLKAVKTPHDLLQKSFVDLDAA